MSDCNSCIYKKQYELLLKTVVEKELTNTTKYLCFKCSADCELDSGFEAKLREAFKKGFKYGWRECESQHYEDTCMSEPDCFTDWTRKHPKGQRGKDD